jgi:pimeloyl-ACP methyl ester carboxylesterase
MSQSTPTAGGRPTVVLVHGAWADGSSWAGVITALQQAGVAVAAPANPLRSLSGDSAYLASVVGQVAGPVLLVGHSYGGAVITNAASQAGNVAGLVYVAAFIPDEGESVLDLANQATDSLLGPALRPAQYPTGAGSKPGTELFIDPASFQAVFCADLPAAQAAVMAATQRPAADVAFGEPSKTPAWKTLPSWAAVGTADKAVGVTESLMMAQRAGASTVEVDASHVIMTSQPKAVSDLIHTALGSLS